MELLALNSLRFGQKPYLSNMCVVWHSKCASVSKKIWHELGLVVLSRAQLQKKKRTEKNASFCSEQHHFGRRHCRWISRCLTTKALASVWDDMCWPKSRSIFGGRRGCQHPLGLRVTDGPNHTERHGHIHPEHALMYHLAFPKMELTSYQPYQKNSQSL